MLVKENCFISDLIKEVENTLSKLCSIKVKIKTLKNSVNAVLPDWYPVAPLLRNKDEIFAFTGSAADMLNIDFTRNANCSANAANQVQNSESLFGSCLMPDSGFTSPVMKLGASEELDRTPELTEMDVGQVGRQENQNISGQALSQDESNELLREKSISLKDHNQGETKQNDKHVQLGNSCAKLTVRAQETKMSGKSGTEEKKGDPEMDDESTSDSSDENSSKSNKSIAKMAKSIDANKLCESKNFSQEISNSKAEAQINESSQKSNIKRKNASLTTKSVWTNSGTSHNSDSSDDSTENEQMDVDGKHENRKVVSIESKATISVKKSNENIEVDSRSMAKARHQESESSDSSSGSEHVVDSGNKVDPRELESRQVDSPDVPAKRRDRFDKNKSVADHFPENTTKDSENGKVSITKQIVKPKGDDKAGKTTTQSTTQKGESIGKQDGSSSDDSNSDSDDNKATRKTNIKNKGSSFKQNVDKAKNDINARAMSTPKDMAKQTNAIKKPSKRMESDSSCNSDSSWSSSEGEDEDKLAKTKGSKNENETVDRTDKKESQSAKTSKSENPTTTAAKSSRKTEKNSITKVKAKKKDAVMNDDKENQTNLDRAPSLASAPSNKEKGISSKNNLASPAKRIKGNRVSSKSKSKDTEAQGKSESESSVSTLKEPFTQLPTSTKGKPKVYSGSQDDSGNKKVKDKETVTNDAATPAHQTQPNEPSWFPQTPPTSKCRKSSVMMSTSKVASWLLSNPVSDNEADATSIGAKTPQRPKTRSKSKSKNDSTKVVEEKPNEILQTNSQNKTMNDDPNIDLVADNVIDSKKTPATPSQKRKLDEGNKQEDSMKSKKNKKKKSEKNTTEEQQLTEEPQGNQNMPSNKIPASTKPEDKNTLLSLPKISKGLSALVEDESDYPANSDKRSQKQKHAPPRINRRLKRRGFLTSPNNVERKGSASKIPKSRIKKIPSQPSKTVEMNEKEREFLDSSALNLDALLNDETVKW